MKSFAELRVMAFIVVYKVLSTVVVFMVSGHPIPLIAFVIADLSIAGYAAFWIARKQARKVLSAPPRLTHATINGLEDGIAILIDILKEIEISLRFINGRAKDLLAVLQKLREGPHAYKDTPSGIVRRGGHAE